MALASGQQQKPGLCCLPDQEEGPRNPDPKLVGTWNVGVDWTCQNSTQKQSSQAQQRQWVLQEDGSCYDTNGNVCTWAAENGKLWVNFLTIPLYFRGRYNSSEAIATELTGRLYNENCDEGCLTSIRANPNGPAPAKPQTPKQKDDSSYKVPRFIDATLLDKPWHLNLDWSCSGSGNWGALMLNVDGSCMDSSGNTCTWSAKGGNININFAGGLRLRGNYSQNGMRGTMQNQSCQNGCWGAAPVAPAPPAFQPPSNTQPQPQFPEVIPPYQLPPVYYGNPPPIYNPPNPSYMSPN